MCVTSVARKFLPKLPVTYLEPADDGHLEVELLGGGDHPLGDDVTAHDAAENVHQDRVHLAEQAELAATSPPAEGAGSRADVDRTMTTDDSLIGTKLMPFASPFHYEVYRVLLSSPTHVSSSRPVLPPPAPPGGRR